MPKTIQERFYNDPEWHQVEDLVMEFINPLLDMKTIDQTQAAEHVKAEVIGRTLAYDALLKFVRGAKIVNKDLPDRSNIFR